jgi:hypothetical protein
VSKGNTIRVHHWNHIDNEVFEKKLRLFDLA